ncbi:hypothetical protein ERJ75_000831100 [Trypanosoma vivax]|uniref:Uncharacterized protein n=1 Tax=Trypanosoma vivax (strain Y486) TaxID=1055687 RepID=G0TZ14_TRYVY|nr:hypothetical protein ERJ75_000831100 [Trypanosoma vivax]CCC49217.1 conserved hypothetical protein [Trypanosoma vivax Y486]
MKQRLGSSGCSYVTGSLSDGRMPSVSRLSGGSSQKGVKNNASNSKSDSNPSNADMNSGCNTVNVCPRNSNSRVASSPSINEARTSGLLDDALLTGISSIRRAAVDSELNSLSAWVMPQSLNRSTLEGEGMATAQPAVVTPPVATTNSEGRPSGDSNQRVSSHLLGEGEARGVPSDARPSTEEQCVSDAALYKSHVDKFRARCETLKQKERDSSDWRMKCRDEAMFFIKETSRLNFSMGIQRMMYTQAMNKLADVPAGVVGLPFAGVAVPRRSLFPALAMPPVTMPRNGTRGLSITVPSPDNGYGKGGAQAALSLLKSHFISGNRSPPRVVVGAPPSIITNAVPPATSACGGRADSIGLAGAAGKELKAGDSRIQASLPPFDSQSTTFSNNGPNGRTSKYASEARFDHCSESVLVEEAAPSFCDSGINQPKPSLPSCTMTSEEGRALELFATVRLLRRQTEQLVADLLHAVGEWGCWKSSCESRFSGLFMTPEMARYLMAEERAMDARLVEIATKERQETGEIHPITAALLQHGMFMRSMPPPPPIASQMEFSCRLEKQMKEQLRREQQAAAAKGLEHSTMQAKVLEEACTPTKLSAEPATKRSLVSGAVQQGQKYDSMVSNAADSSTSEELEDTYSITCEESNSSHSVSTLSQGKSSSSSMPCSVGQRSIVSSNRREGGALVSVREPGEVDDLQDRKEEKAPSSVHTPTPAGSKFPSPVSTTILKVPSLHGLGGGSPVVPRPRRVSLATASPTSAVSGNISLSRNAENRPSLKQRFLRVFYRCLCLGKDSTANAVKGGEVPKELCASRSVRMNRRTAKPSMARGGEGRVNEEKSERDESSVRTSGPATGRGGATAGRSGSATGRGGATAGRSGSATGRGGATAGRSGSATGRGGATAGRSGSATGRGGATAGRSGSATGRGGATAGRSGSATGRGGATAGRSGSATGRGGATAGRSGSATGRGGAAAGRSGSATGRGGAAAGRSGSTKKK